MYFIVSWDISAVEPQWSRIDEQMRNCLRGFESIRPVNTYYIVKVNSKQQYEDINTCLLKVAQAQTATVHYISTPLQSLSHSISDFKGWLPKDQFPKITAITS